MIDEECNENGFITTGTILFRIGMTAEGKLVWTWEREGVEREPAMGYLEVAHDELKIEAQEARMDIEDD